MADNVPQQAVRWFASYAPNGEVSHLVRITETDTELRGEYLRDGSWHEDGAVFDYLVDRTLGNEIDADMGEALAIRLGAVPDDPLARGFAEYFADFALRLPTPIAPVGLLEQGDWTVRYRLAESGGRLDFLALHPHTAPVHGEVHADGTVAIHDTYRDHIATGPDATEEEVRRAELQLEAHNQRVTDELVRKGLA